MASPLITQTTGSNIIRNLQATSEGVAHTFRGDWQPNIKYNKNDYVYSAKHLGFMYVATNSGTSQSEKEGRTTISEPAWILLGSYTYDGVLQFLPEEVTEEQAKAAKVWYPLLKVKVGELVVPSTGAIVVKGSEDQFFAFRLVKCLINLDWPVEPRAYLTDNDIVWECRVSYGKLLPVARLREPMYQELVEIMDFLKLHEEMYFDDLTYKYADQMRVRTTSVKEVAAEFGYNYITDFIGLTDKELQSAIEYISLIHYLKGHESGLSLVFELLGVTARWEEWWEATPVGIPDTWKLWVDIDIAKAQGSLANKIINFTRQYVYPVMQEFEVTYSVNLIKLGVAVGGFFDAEYQFEINSGLLVMQGVGVYIDKSYSFNLEAVVHPVLGKTDVYVGQVFGFASLFGKIGSWGSQWIRYDYNTNNKVPIAFDTSDVSEPEALALITVADKRP